jgi:hypothetical protein
LTDSTLVTILSASASYGGGCSAGVYQQIVINKQRFFFMDLQSIIENYGYAAILIGTFLESSFCSMPPARWSGRQPSHPAAIFSAVPWKF